MESMSTKSCKRPSENLFFPAAPTPFFLLPSHVSPMLCLSAENPKRTFAKIARNLYGVNVLLKMQIVCTRCLCVNFKKKKFCVLFL